MIDRRHFLIGAGALLTASFVRRASTFSKKTGRPLILPTVQEPEETLYVYWQADSEVANWRVSLGPDQPFATASDLAGASAQPWVFPRDG